MIIAIIVRLITIGWTLFAGHGEPPEQYVATHPCTQIIWRYDSGEWLAYIPAPLTFLSDPGFETLSPAVTYWALTYCG